MPVSGGIAMGCQQKALATQIKPASIDLEVKWFQSIEIE
jgi:hypothetical protein